MRTHDSPLRFMRRLAGLVTALAVAFVSVGNAHAAFLFQDDAFHLIPSEGIFLNSDGTPGTNTAKLDVDGSGNLTIDVDGEIDTQDNFTISNAIFTVDGTGTVDFSAAASTRLREETFTAYTGVGTAPTCTTVGEVAIDLTTNALYVCTNTGTDTWEPADNTPADGTASGNMLYWDGTAWVETTAITTDGTDVNVTGELDTDGVIVAGSGDTQITNATGDLQQTYDFTNDNVLTNDDSVYSALDKIDAEFALIDFEYVYGNDADSTLTASGAFDVDAAGAVGIDSDSTMTIGGTVVGITADGGTLDLTGDGTNDINIANTGAAIDVDSATFTLDTTGAFSVDSVGTSNVTVDTGDLQLYTTTSGNVDINAVDDISFTDQFGTLTFAQTSALGGDLLNGLGEIYEATGTIGSTIGAGETSTSLIHAINAVGTYAAAIGAGANDDIDDVYNNGATGTYTATVDASPTGYDITSTDGDAFFVKNSGANIASFSVNATDESIIGLNATEASNFTVATDAAGEDLTIAVTGATDSSVVVNSSGTGTDAVDINATAGGVAIDAAGASNFTTSSGNLTLSATAGQIVFDDLQLTGTVQMSDTAADWAIVLPSDGIVDNINAFTSTANGEGASLVGIEDAGGYFSPAADVEAALQELGAAGEQ